MTRALRHQPSKPMLAASATADEIVFVQEETSADGEPRGTVHRMRVTMSDPAVRGAWSHGLAEPRPRDLAWARDPECCECRTRITSPSQCGLIETPTGPRVACKPNGCLVQAILRTAPGMRTGGKS